MRVNSTNCSCPDREPGHFRGAPLLGLHRAPITVVLRAAGWCRGGDDEIGGRVKQASKAKLGSSLGADLISFAAVRHLLFDNSVQSPAPSLGRLLARRIAVHRALDPAALLGAIDLPYIRPRRILLAPYLNRKTYEFVHHSCMVPNSRACVKKKTCVQIGFVLPLTPVANHLNPDRPALVGACGSRRLDAVGLPPPLTGPIRPPRPYTGAGGALLCARHWHATIGQPALAEPQNRLWIKLPSPSRPLT
jgi:hypothetical protein